MQRARSQVIAVGSVEPSLPLIGLGSERLRLENALMARESLLLLGPRGCGKTKLLREVIRNVPASGQIVYTRCPPVLHDLLIALSRALVDSRHRTFARIANSGLKSDTWISRQTSVHLKGVLWKALEAEPRILVIDDIEGAGARTYRFLQRLYYAPGMSIIAAGRDVRALGDLAKLFWDPRRTVHFRPLSEPESRDLFEQAADHFGLRSLDLQDFREKVLETACGNAGQITEMCRLATQPQYICGTHVKFAPLRIDALIHLAG